MQIYTRLLLCLCTALLMPGCGDEPEAPKQENTVEPSENAQGPVVPEAGVVVLNVNPNRPYPECLFPPDIDTGYLLDYANTAAVSSAKEIDPEATLYFRRVGSNDGLQFWVERSEPLDDEAATALAGVIAEKFWADIDELFDEHWDIDRAGYQAELDIAIQARVEAQEELRRFREARRGLDATPESRRELAQLEHRFTTRNEVVGEIQASLDRIANNRERGQRVFRRINR